MLAKVYFPQGADEFVVDAGGKVTIKEGGGVLVEAGGSVEIQAGGIINMPLLTPQKDARAVLKTGDSASVNVVTIAAKAIGMAGNSISVAFVADDEAEDVAVTVEGAAITVKCVVEEETIITTAAEVSAAITATPAAMALVTASGSGSGAVESLEATPLAGGKDTTPAKKGEIYFDITNIYIAVDDMAITDDGSGWHVIQHTALS